MTDARLLANKCDASTEFAQKRNRKRKTFHDEVNAGQPGPKDAQLNFKQTVFYVIVDTISSELNIRFENLGQISEKFCFILQMSEMSKEDLEESTRCYAAKSWDVSNDLIQEVCSVSALLRAKPQFKNLTSFFRETLIHYSRIWLLH